MSLPDGSYSIVSVAWPTQTLVFVGDDSYGPLSGLELVKNNNNQGRRLVANVSKGQVTLQSQAALDPSPFVWREADGVPVTGNTVSYNWVVTLVEPDIFEISNADRTLFWALENGDNYYVVVVRAPSNIEGKTALFRIVPNL